MFGKIETWLLLLALAYFLSRLVWLKMQTSESPEEATSNLKVAAFLTLATPLLVPHLIVAILRAVVEEISFLYKCARGQIALSEEDLSD